MDHCCWSLEMHLLILGSIDTIFQESQEELHGFISSSTFLSVLPSHLQSLSVPFGNYRQNNKLNFKSNDYFDIWWMKASLDGSWYSFTVVQLLQSAVYWIKIIFDEGALRYSYVGNLGLKFNRYLTMLAQSMHKCHCETSTLISSCFYNVSISYTTWQFLIAT